MKKSACILVALAFFIQASAQSLTYNNFSKSITDVTQVAVIEQSSFPLALLQNIGKDVSWNAAGIKANPAYPLLNLTYKNPSSVANGSQYQSSNYARLDPALTNLVGSTFFHISQDSLVLFGSYEPSTAHEIFQNPDKSLIFPFSYGESFEDNYRKTNYSNATTISSYQKGKRTVSFNGFGSLQLPQGNFSQVGLISEIRTNNLGPDSYTYTWYNLLNGKTLLLYEKNGDKITIAACTDIPSALENNIESESILSFSIINQTLYINNLQGNEIIKVFSIDGKEINSIICSNTNVSIPYRCSCLVLIIRDNAIIEYRKMLFF